MIQNDDAKMAELRAVESALTRLLSSCPGAQGALVATDDGFVVAKVFKQEMAAKTLAAITSSVMSLSESMIKETQQGPCNNVIVEGQGGNIVSLRISKTRVLTAMAGPRTRLGMLLSSAKVCAEQLTKTLAGRS